MNAKEHTRANKWAAHVKESSMNRRDEVRVPGRFGRVCRPKHLKHSIIGRNLLPSSLTYLILLNDYKRYVEWNA